MGFSVLGVFRFGVNRVRLDVSGMPGVEGGS